jgi:hypothetical protein
MQPGSLPIKSAMTGGNTVGAEVREEAPRADGYRHIDTPRLISQLRAANVTTYTYGIWDSPTDWDDLRLEFLPSAAKAGIDVWVYLVPPSESFRDGRSSKPFEQDYLSWAREIARLSQQFPNLTGWGIDDFHIGQNQDKFRTDYVQQMHDTCKAINPNLRFWLCAYFDAAIDTAFLDKYRPFVDGLIYPYLDDPCRNTEDATAVGARLDDILKVTGPRGMGLILLVYCGRFLDTARQPTEAYVRDCVHTGMEYAKAGKIQGVLAYGLPLDGKPAPATDNRAMYGIGRLALTVAPHTPTSPGNMAWAEQQVQVDPSAPRYELSFWHRNDNSTSPDMRDYHVKQVLIDDVVVWAECVTLAPPRLWINGHDWQGPVDVSAQLRGKASAKLTFRLFENKGVGDFGIDTSFDEIRTIGFTVGNPGFETLDGWRFDSNHPGMTAGIDLAPPDRPQRIHAAVGAEYAS